MLRRVGELIAVLSVVLSVVLIYGNYAGMKSEIQRVDVPFEDTLPPDVLTEQELKALPMEFREDQRKILADGKVKYEELKQERLAVIRSGVYRWYLIDGIIGLVGVAFGLVIRKV